jgi:hypothetical protein
MRFVCVAVGVLVLAVGHVPRYPDNSVIATAAAAGKAGAQGVSGRPQKNGTVKGSPKPNSSINGSQTRGKH